MHWCNERLNDAQARSGKPGTLENIDGWEPMGMSNTVMKGYILVSQDVLNRKEDLDFWINLALEFNPLAKASKKKKIK